MTFDDLTEAAFPPHEVTPHQLRTYLYAKKAFSEDYDHAVEAHIANCPDCQKRVKVMMVTDEILNGEWDRKVKVRISTSE